MPVAHATGSEVLGPDVLRGWVHGAVRAVATHRAQLDTMNVFPVPDSDTGTNLWLTLGEAGRAVDRLPSDATAGEVATALVRGAVVGARGNSGVIVSQYLAGLLEAALAGGAWPDALGAAADAAYRSVGTPVEGTVLTVARAVEVGAVAAQEDGRAAGRAGAEPEDPAVAVLVAGLVSGFEALARTSGTLPALRRAGVQDAGAWGLLLVLGELVRALGGVVEDDPGAGDAGSHERLDGERGGTPSPADPAGQGGCDDGTHDAGTDDDGDHDHDHDHHDHGGGEFEVMFVVDGARADRTPGERLRAGLERVGGSVAVVGASGLWQAHVHTDGPLAALAVATDLGTPTRPACIRHLPTQSGVHGAHRPALGLVAVTHAPGLVADLARAGAVVVLVGPDQVLTDELRRAADDTGADDVLVLAVDEVPGSARPGGVEVVDGLSEVQVAAGATALALAPTTAAADDVREAVSAATARVRWAGVPGVGGAGHADAVLATATDLLTAPGVEVLTVLVGERCDEDVVRAAETAVASRSAVELVVLRSGVPDDDVLLGVE